MVASFCVCAGAACPGKSIEKASHECWCHDRSKESVASSTAFCCAESALGYTQPLLPASILFTLTCLLKLLFLPSFFHPKSVLFNDVSGQSIVGCGLDLGLYASGYETSLGWQISAATYNELKLVCACSQAGTCSGCFSEDATVEIEGHGNVSIAELNVGDNVRTASGSFRPVHSFGHRDEGAETKFTAVHTEHSDKPLELTPEHVLFVDEKACMKIAKMHPLFIADLLEITEQQADRTPGPWAGAN